MEWWQQIVDRIGPVDALAPTARELLVLLGLVVAVVVLGPAWRAARLGVTLVHELGHAVVGVLCGRRFTGFVLRMDASGHAVTQGPARGFGRIATTWAGYPAPAVVGAVLIVAAAHGWAPPVLALALVVLLGSLIRVRSFLTAVVLLAVIAVVGLLWWAADPLWQGLAVLGMGALLLVGSWRHLGSVARDRSRGSDPAVLAALTPVPRLLWMASFVMVLGVLTWWAGLAIIAVLP
ncbi:M50 family metallopeptidase [Ruania alkalisoli]|uniref:M50 family metallopeptidase n=1 Tax=Ruania alkalisoli TaxID=2779775 RepID=A0A7M1SSJ6_9MICO|nr:M50 family metallopeptidase [Ruania alkalisoli]QOR70431.1 M50 family metallopeptidase [Ruania alkalisoli]